MDLKSTLSPHAPYSFNNTEIKTDTKDYCFTVQKRKQKQDFIKEALKNKTLDTFLITVKSAQIICVYNCSSSRLKGP